MSISVNVAKRNRQPLKTALIYLVVSAFCFLVDKVYALYGHGVTSPAMTFLFLYPLLGGALVFLLLWFVQPWAAAVPRYRAAYNLYNSGIATLAAGSLLKGIFEIAGTSSPYTVLFYIVGGLLIAAGVIGFGIGERRILKPRARP